MAVEAEAKLGRPTQFDEAYIEQAQKLCLLGATDDEMADFFKVHRSTLYRWKLEHPDFCDAIKSAKAYADERVERSLYQKAVGYDVTEEQAVKVKADTHIEKVEVVEVRKHIQADTTAAIFWLKNRRSEDWRDVKQIDARHMVAHRHELANLSTEQLEAIEAILDQPDGAEGGTGLALPAPLH